MKEAAYDLACRAYANRVFGIAPPEERRYHGDFDVEAVVEEAEVPVSHSLTDHQAAWAEFRRLFEQRWMEAGF